MLSAVFVVGAIGILNGPALPCRRPSVTADAIRPLVENWWPPRTIEQLSAELADRPLITAGKPERPSDVWWKDPAAVECGYRVELKEGRPYRVEIGFAASSREELWDALGKFVEALPKRSMDWQLTSPLSDEIRRRIVSEEKFFEVFERRLEGAREIDLETLIVKSEQLAGQKAWLLEFAYWRLAIVR